MSMKSAVKEHVSNSQVTEHVKKHGSFLLNEIIIDGFISKLEVVNQDFIKYRDGMEFKKFSRQDLDNSAKLYKEVFSQQPWNDEWIRLSRVKEYLNELIENPVFSGYVVYQNSELLAACFGHSRSWWSGDEFFIDEFFVSSRYQGRGIGSLLMGYVENHPELENIESFHLLTNNNVPARDFYHKNGFKTRKNRITMTKKFF
ncbi:MAG: GNAT family N-acetyltransferase [Methanobacterium sp.]|nr:GNAT family N-acetyltransferase [Methanobacterium sp.]